MSKPPAGFHYRQFLYECLPQYEGVEFEVISHPERFDYELKATKGNLSSSLTVRKEDIFQNDPVFMAKQIEKVLREVSEFMERIQVDLRIKDEDAEF